MSAACQFVETRPVKLRLLLYQGFSYLLCRGQSDARTTRHPGYAASQISRELIETIFGDGKEHGTLRQLKLRVIERAQRIFVLTVTAVDLRRLSKLFAASG